MEKKHSLFTLPFEQLGDERARRDETPVISNGQNQVN
jgi:hypothetical protein